MSTERTILLVGDFITDRTWLVGNPSQNEYYNSHYAVHPHMLIDPERDTDVAGGIATIARAIASVRPDHITVMGAWSATTQSELDSGRLVPPEGQLNRGRLRFSRLYESTFTTVKTRVYLPEPGGARLVYRFDRNSSADMEVRSEQYCEASWPDPDDVDLVILADYGYGVLQLPSVREKLRSYTNRCTPVALKSSSHQLVGDLDWDILMLNLHHFANLLGREPFDRPVAKRLGDVSNYHPSLVLALEAVQNALERNGRSRALILNLESEGAIVLHNGVVSHFILAAPHTDALSGVGANDVFWAHFGMGMIGLNVDFADRLRISACNALRASAAFVSKVRQVESIQGWHAPRVAVSAADVDMSSPVVVQPSTTLKQLRLAAKEAEEPLASRRIKLRDAGWYLDGFHTVDPGFGEEIVRLKHRIKEYISNRRPSRPFLTVLCGDPGSGKSSLAEALGQYSGCTVIQANAAQWTSMEDLFDLCDRIRNTRMIGKIPLAFIDEVDSPAQNNDLFAKLLAPVWDGTYSVGGATRTLETPVVFLLAGSGEAWRSSEALFRAAESGNVPKLVDLVSRFSTNPLEIRPLRERLGDIPYIVAHQIVRHFPLVNAAAEGIFKLFVDSRYGPRSIASVIDKFGPLKQERFLDTTDLRPLNLDTLSLHLRRIPNGWYESRDRIEILT